MTINSHALKVPLRILSFNRDSNFLTQSETKEHANFGSSSVFVLGVQNIFSFQYVYDKEIVRNLKTRATVF